MPVEYFIGQRARADGTLRFGLNPHGQIYISAALARAAHLTAGHARLGYDRAEKLFVLEPVPAPGPGTVRLAPAKGGTASFRVTCREALRYFGLMPDKKINYEAEVRNGRICVPLPRDRGAPAPAARESAKAAALNAALDYEDEPAPKGQKAEIGLPLKPRVRGKCETCLKWARGRCRSCDGPKANLATGAADGCDSYIARPAPAQRPAARSTHGRATGHRPRAACPHCHGLFPISGKGLYPHDLQGVMYIAGRGNVRDRCPGSHSRAEQGA